MSRWEWLLCIGLGLAGCAPEFPRPITSQDLVRFHSAAALVAYLRQPDASPSVCDPRATGPHVVHLDDDMRSALVHGLTDGDIDPDLWRRCVAAALGGGDGPPLLARIGEGYVALVENRELETSPTLQARLAAMQAVITERPNVSEGPGQRLGPLFAQLRGNLEGHRLGPVATRLAGDLLVTRDLEQGTYGGRTVDVALIDGLYARRDEGTLRRFIDRLPSKGLQDDARRRVIRLQIARSPFEEVRAQAELIEERLMRYGFNRIIIDAGQSERWKATLDAQSTGVIRRVRVRQDVLARSASLLGTDPRAGVSVLPEIPLVGTLWISMPSLSRPITLCREPRALDPSPCIGPDDIQIASPLAHVDPRVGALHFLDRIGSKEVVRLASAGDRLTVPLTVAGRQVLSVELPFTIERPTNVVFSGVNGKGPALHVTIAHPGGLHFLFTVSRGGAEYPVVVQNVDLPTFRITSLGAPGADGSPGTSGTDGNAGLDGSSASCPSMSGSDGSAGAGGGDGGPGGDGADGSDGGDIQVDVDCSTVDCSTPTLAALRRVVTSEGGPGGSGGAGGSGGRGGRGGAGGSGTSCTDADGASSSLFGGSAGMNGSDGSTGATGADGSPGRPGKVQLNVHG